MRFNQLITDMTSEEYHSTGGTFSSSQLKTMLEDPEVFYKKYITKELARESSTAFDMGTYFHTAILEPHLLEKECAVYEGGVRSGAKWEAFKEANKGKAIITPKEKETCGKMISAVHGSPISMAILAKSTPEVSMFVELFVMGSDVFGFRDGNCMQLTSMGWVPCFEHEEEDIKEFAVRIVVKVRADALCIGNGTIADLKSTTGNAAKKHDVIRSIGTYQYDLSTALYLDIFTLGTGELYDTFVWIFASKDFGNARPWKASQKNVMVGRAKWKKSIVTLAKCLANNWTFEEELEEIDPPQYALEWLNEI
jgi:hypothetical protein